MPSIHTIDKLAQWKETETCILKYKEEYLKILQGHEGARLFCKEGSRVEGVAGPAAYADGTSKLITLPPVSSIFSTELRAILVALEEVTTMKIAVSDSQFK